jgi:hypothetical protein
MKNCDIIFFACKFNEWCVPPFIKLFRKFCGYNDDLILVSENDYSTDIRCSFIRLPGHLVGKDGNCPKNRFSDSLIHGLKSTPNKNAIVLLADYFIDKPVDIPLLEKSIEYINNTPNILRIDIGGIAKPNPCTQLTEWLYECAQSRDCFYPISLCPGIWNKELYLQLLRPGWDPWQTEQLSYKNFLVNPKMRSIWSYPPISYVNVMRARDNNNLCLPPHLHDDVKSYIPSRFKY